MKKEEIKSIQIKKKENKYIIHIESTNSIDKLLEELQKHLLLIKVVNVNLFVDFDNNTIKSGTCHIIEKKNIIYTIFCNKDSLILSKKEKKKEITNEKILTWYSDTNKINFKIYSDKKDRKRILDYQYSENSTFGEEEKNIQFEIKQLLDEFEEIGYRIPIKVFHEEKILKKKKEL